MRTEWLERLEASLTTALHSPTKWNIGDALSEALVVGDYDAVARLTALEGAPIARGENPRLDEVDVGHSDLALRSLARALKREISSSPRSALARLDLALIYTTLGQTNRAQQQIEIALALHPESRLLLRSAAAFFVHADDPDRAFRLLSQAPTAQRDPWILAASMSVASISGRAVPSIRAALDLLEHSPEEHRTELAAAIATEELAAGADKRAQRQFRRALRLPTENALAQVEWAASKSRAVARLDLDASQVPNAYEAAVRRNYLGGHLREALEAGLQWFDFQPFSEEAAATASYIAAVGLEAHSHALRVCQEGLRANPDSSLLLNNAAFSQASLDQLRAARQSVDRFPVGLVGTTIEHTATAGLLSFREGDLPEGRRLYAEAIALASQRGDRRGEVLASLYWRREERRLGFQLAPGAESTLLQLARQESDPAIRALATREDVLS